MLIYEKDNKLNINFDNEISENPDLQIGKSGDKTEVLIDGQQGSGSGGSFVIRVNEIAMDKGTKYELDKTWQEISDAIEAGMHCCIVEYERADKDNDEMVPAQKVVAGMYIDNRNKRLGLLDVGGTPIEYTAVTENDYPSYFENDATEVNPGSGIDGK